LFFIVVLIIPADKPVKEVEQVKPPIVKTVVLTPQQIESNKYDKWVEEQFTQYDGGRAKLIKMVKDNLNDPDSFKYVSNTRSFDGKDLIIIMTYRTKNMFGGVVAESVRGKVSYKDNGVAIIK